MDNYSRPRDTTMSYKDWALTIFLGSLPIIGFILVLIWAFDNNTNIHKQNWAKGTLLLMVIGIVVAMMFLFLFGGMALLSGLF